MIDNNTAERAMRHVVLDHRNWTFAGSAEGGHCAAKIDSIVATGHQLSLDPLAWFSGTHHLMGWAEPSRDR